MDSQHGHRITNQTHVRLKYKRQWRLLRRWKVWLRGRIATGRSEWQRFPPKQIQSNRFSAHIGRPMAVATLSPPKQIQSYGELQRGHRQWQNRSPQTDSHMIFISLFLGFSRQNSELGTREHNPVLCFFMKNKHVSLVPTKPSRAIGRPLAVTEPPK